MRFSPLGTKLYFHANSTKKDCFLLTTNMAALSRGCKPRIKLSILSILALETFRNKYSWKERGICNAFC